MSGYERVTDAEGHSMVVKSGTSSGQDTRKSEMKKLIVLLSMFFVGTLYAQSMVTSGDINKSMVTDYKQFFTKENCNQVLIDTFSICYDWKRKSPTAVYVEVTGENVVKDIEKRPPFFTDKRVKKQYRTTSKDYTKSGYDRGHFGKKSDASHDWNKKHQKGPTQ